MNKKTNQEIVLQGIAAAPGIILGQAFLLDSQDFVVTERSIYDDEVPIEIARFEEALSLTKNEIIQIKNKIEQDVGRKDAQIFDAHLLVLEDSILMDEIKKRIQTQKVSAEYAFSQVLKKYVAVFEGLKDEYIKERSADIIDIGRRVLRHLMGEAKAFDFDLMASDVVIVAHDISPSSAVNMYHKKVIGFLTDVGGRTAHTAIIAKSLGVTAVVGLKDATLRINNQDDLIVDGVKGLVIVNPSEETKRLYQGEKKRLESVDVALSDIKGQPAQTQDDHRVHLLANFEFQTEFDSFLKSGAEGIGLYRTEFLYMNRLDLPSEEEQYQTYRQVAETLGEKPMIIRTLDLGGDKFLSSLQLPKEMTPFLGTRAIRLCLEDTDIFKTQLRAVLRASAHGNVMMMYPMIAGPSELKAANVIFNAEKQRMREKKIPFNETMKVGVMIELPSAVMTADLLAQEVDFFSIGTNDLIQYSLAVDRSNEKMARFYEPTHPGVLKLILKTIEEAHQAKIPVSVCGEMASDPVLAILLMGLGIDSFSMSTNSILRIKKAIRSFRFSDIQKMAQESLMQSSGQEVEEFLVSRIYDLVPDFDELIGQKMRVSSK